MKLAAVIVVALLSTVLTDAATVGLLGALRSLVDVNVNYWIIVLAPVVAVVVAVQALALWRVYRTRPVHHAAVYLAVFAAAEIVWLNIMLNPAGDIIRYVVTILGIGTLVMTLFVRFAWRAPV